MSWIKVLVLALMLGCNLRGKSAEAREVHGPHDSGSSQKAMLSSDATQVRNDFGVQQSRESNSSKISAVFRHSTHTAHACAHQYKQPTAAEP